MIRTFINRKEELKWLAEAYRKASGQGQLLVIYGKRRVGKTELVTHFFQGKPCVCYYLANRTTKEEQLRSATAVFAAGLGDSYLTGAGFPGWREFFDYLIKKVGERRKPNKPQVLIFDEFPYLAEADKGIASFFQYGWDMGLKDRKVLLVLMGSSISMMYREVLVKSAPLYGRRTGQWLVEPFNFGQTKIFYPGAGFANSFSLYAVSGGIPAYARVFDGQKTLKENILAQILPEGKYLAIEPELLLAEEFDDPRSYLTILQAIGLGRTKFSQILQQSQLPATALPVYLKTLIDLRLVKKEVPVTETVPQKSKKGSYSLSDPFLRFYFSFIFPNSSLVKSRAYNLLFARHGAVLTRLVSKAYEDAAVEFVRRAIKQGAMPDFEQIGRWWDKNTEIDLVGLNEEANAILFGEVKWNNRPLKPSVLTELRQKAEKVSWGKPGRREYFVLVAKGGFSPELAKLAKKEGVYLIKEAKLTGI